MPGGFVLDASVSMRWILQDGSLSDCDYADSVLDSMADHRATVPALWYTETTHVLRGAEDKGALSASISDAFMHELRRLPIDLDTIRPQSTQAAVASTSRKLTISAYDAQYLELAMRLALPIATLDVELRQAASEAGVAIYSP